MILTGRSVSASKARRLGIVDEVTQPAIINAIAIQAARRLIDRGVQRRRRSGGAMGWLLDGNPLGRRIVYAGARRQVEKKSRGQYPAPLAAIDAVRTGLERGMTSIPSLESSRSATYHASWCRSSSPRRPSRKMKEYRPGVRPLARLDSSE
jgi:enoyl-CoA hydratase/carnithine racemase